MKNHFKQNIYPQSYFVGKLFIIIVIFVLEANYTLAQQKLSLEEAIITTIQHNRRIRIDSAVMGINQQKTRPEQGVFLPRVEFNTQVNHYFQQPAAFNSAIDTGEADQIGYVRPGGKDQASADVSMEMPLPNIKGLKAVCCCFYPF